MRKAHDEAKKVDEKLGQFYQKEMMAFEKEIKEMIGDIAKAEGWDLVLAKEAVIYASESTDKTDTIVRKLDALEISIEEDKEVVTQAKKPLSSK